MSNRPSRQRSRTAVDAMATSDSSRTTWILVVILVLVMGAAVAAIALTAGGSADFDYGTVETSGTALPPMPDSPEEADPAIGVEAPEAFGASHDGEPVEITADGRPKVLLFLAHWCPHCQAEVPVIQDWIDTNGVPEEVDLISVSTRFQPGREEWPPDEWLETAGWTPPVLVDDEDDTVATMFALGGTPYWVVIGADGKVVARRSGEIGAEGLAELIELARSTAGEGVTTTAASTPGVSPTSTPEGSTPPSSAPTSTAGG